MKNAHVKGAAPGNAKPLSLRSTLTRISALTRELSVDLDYASAPSTQRYWNVYQKRRSRQSIARKQAESLQLIASLPPPFDKQLLDVTKAIWRAEVVEHRNGPDPAVPLIERQAELIAEARREHSAPAARRIAA
jgi:hypothetical protein